jgi:hypothetical protein
MDNDGVILPAGQKLEGKLPSTAGLVLTLSDPPIATVVRQDDFSPGKGNALQACVASLFGQPMHEVPNFVTLECGYQQGIEQYVQEQSKLKVIKKKVCAEETVSEDEGKLCMLRGKSPRGNFGHVVVARKVRGGFEMVHDPHPDDTFLDPEEAYGWYMIFVPC